MTIDTHLLCGCGMPYDEASAADVASARNKAQSIVSEGEEPVEFSPGMLCSLGKLFYKLGLERQAANCFKKAGDDGDTLAQYYYGFCCAKGIGIAKDTGESHIWYEKIR